MLSVTNKNVNFKVEVTHRGNKNANFKVEVTQQNSRANDVEEEPHLMSVIVLLILSASAIAMPPLGPSLFSSKLQNEGVTRLV
jgi:hypothetical protein